MSRLTRLLQDTDNLEWRRYKKRLLKANGRFYGVVLFFLIVIPVVTVIYLHYGIEANRRQGMPPGFLLTPFHDVYRIVKADAVEWSEDAYLNKANFSIYPDWGYYQEPEAELFFLSEKGKQLTISARSVYEYYEISVLHFPMPYSQNRYQYVAERNSPVTFSDPVLESMDNLEALAVLLENGGNEFILAHKYIKWPARLYLTNQASDNRSFQPVWELCFWEGFVEADEAHCFETEGN